MRTIGMVWAPRFGDLWETHPRAMYMSREDRGSYGEGRGYGRGRRDEEHGHGRERHDDRPPGFEGERRGPRGGRGGPRAGRGDVRSAMLLLLSERPLHGYQIIQILSERSGGCWQPSPGSVYPALQLLEDEGLIQAVQDEGRRVFHLTEAGREYVDAHREEFNAALKGMADTTSNGAMELHNLLRQVGMTVREFAHVGTPEQISAAQKLLINTRRQLYRILAEDDTTTSDSGQA